MSKLAPLLLLALSSACALPPDEDEVVADPVDTSGSLTTATTRVLFSREWSEAPIPAAPISTFALADTEDVYTYLFFQPLEPGIYIAWIEYRLPGGGLYLREHMGVAVGPNQPSEIWFAEGNTSMETWPAMPTALGYRVDFVLPVAGTDIAARALGGGWEVRMGMDPGHEKPLATAPLTLE
jgi:hypothetical protein